MGRTVSGLAGLAAGSRDAGVRGRRWLWAAAVLAGLGMWLQETAAPWLMSDLTEDPRLIAGVQAVTTLAVCLAVVLTGVLVDLTDTARLLRGTHVALAAAALVVVIVVLTDVVGPALLLILAAAMGLGHGVLVAGWPALAAGANAGGLSLAAAQSGHQWTGRTLGGPLAGVVISTVGMAAAFCADAGAFLAVALSLRRMPPARVAESLSARRFGAAFRAGGQTALLTPSTRHALVRGAAAAFGVSCLWSLLVVVARVGLSLSAGGFGLLQAAAGAGAVVGVVLVVRLPRRRLSAGSLLSVLTAAGGCAVGSAGLIPSAAWVAGCAFVAGAAWVACVVVLVAAVQAAVPEHLKARMVGICLGVLYLATALGSVVWGHVAAALGVSVTLALAGGFTLVAALATAPLRMGRLPRP